LGDERVRETVDADLSRESDIYSGVVDVLAALHDHAPLPSLARQSTQMFLDEVGLFLEWYCPAVGITVDEAQFRKAWTEVLAPVMDGLAAPVTVLRDFHAENIMLIEGGQGLGRFGLLDFQDALAGHPAYDLVSLLEDARRDVTPSVEQAMLARYMTARNCGQDFETAYWVLGAQRNCRILGVFARLWKRDSKPRYLQFQPRMWGLLERDFACPALAPVRDWFDMNIAQDKRTLFWNDIA
jgi:N-acetylmuramate 1-kinase